MAKENLILEPLNIDIDLIRESCFRLQKIIAENFSKLDQTYFDNIKNPLGGKYHLHYNTFLFPFSEFDSLFFQIQKIFSKVRDPGIRYYIQSWLNVYEDNGFFDWHSHSDNQKAWHGYFCVNANNSKTQYKFADDIFEDIIEVENINGLLVFGACGNDRHRSQSEWNEKAPRITIAFDIIPEDGLGGLRDLFNHWIPF